MSEFILRQSAGQKLEFAVGRNGCGTLEVEWLSEGENFKSVGLLARGEAELVLKVKPATEVIQIDPIVRVDRSIRPVYPDWVKEGATDTPEFISLEKLGPPEFDASKLRQWVHSKKKKKVVVGTVIYDFLIQKKMLPICLGLADLLGIQAKGIEFFRQHFKNKAVFGWRSVLPRRDGDLLVPCLVLGGGRVVLYWHWLGYGWSAYSPGLRFASLDLRPSVT